MNREKQLLYCDRVIFFSLCLLIFWLPISKAVVESFTLLAFVAWVLKRVFGYRADSLWPMLPKTGLNIALGIYILINALAVIFSTNFGLSLRAFFGKELKFLAIYFMLVEVVNSRERLKYILIAIIFSAVLVVADAIVQYSRGIDFLMGHKWERLTASFSTANGFAGWLIVIIPLFFGLLLAGEVVNKRLKAFLIVITALLSVCLLATYARGAWLGFLVGFSFIAWHVVKKFSLKARLFCLFTGVALIAIFLFLPQPIKSKVTAIGRLNFRSYETINLRVKSVLKIEEGSTLFRFKLWREALRIIRDYNFTGCGLNTYSIVAKEYKSFTGGGIYPHNSYLQKAAETGLFGLVAFLGVLFMFFRIGLRYLNQRKDYLALGFLAGILAFLVQAFFDTHLYSLQLVVLFWYMLGLTMAVIKLGKMEAI